jgi:molybdopterin converting factor small subunit
MISVRLRLFGPLRGIVRRDEISLRVPPPFSGHAAFETLSAEYPALRPWRSSVRLAVNLRYVSFEETLNEGDEISFIPPVSGG